MKVFAIVFLFATIVVSVNTAFTSNGLKRLTFISSFEESSKNDVNTGFRRSSYMKLSSSSTSSEFGELMKERITNKFGKEESVRVVESWNLLERGYVHKEYIGDVQAENIETSNSHQEAHSYVRGLNCRTFWDMNEFDWCMKLQSKYASIRKEFLRVIGKKDLETKGNNVWSSMVNQDAMSYGADWKTLVLMDRGIWDETNCALFPKTAEIIHDCNVPAVEVFFASMQPFSDIKPHSDGVNFLLTSHLPLDIPENGQNKCRLTVGDHTKQWLNGKIMLFDTSILHSAINDTDQTRYVLMMRVWHPHITQSERQALQFTFDCLNVPQLLSTNSQEQFIAEQHVENLHSFPILEEPKKLKKEKKTKQKKKPMGKGFASRKK